MGKKSTKNIIWLFIFIAITMVCIVIIVAVNYYVDKYNNQRKVEYKNSKIYIPNSQWKFLIKNSKFNDIDTLVLQDIEFDTNNALKIYRWKFFKQYSEQNDKIEDIFEIKVDMEDEDDDYVTLHFPSIKNMKFLKLFPGPSLSYPLFLEKLFTFKLKEKTEIDRSLKYDEFTIEAKSKVTDKILYKSNFVNDTCWVIKNDTKTNKIKFQSKYYFNEKYGFVYLYYNFSDYYVELSLIDAKLPN